MGCKSTAIFSIIKNIHLNFWEKPDYFPGGRQRSSRQKCASPAHGEGPEAKGFGRAFWREGAACHPGSES